MGKQKRLLSLQPLTPSQIGINTTEVPGVSPETLQLATDMINVVEGRVAIETFPKEYQEKIKSFYRFSATRYTEDQPVCAKRTTDTLDIV